MGLLTRAASFRHTKSGISNPSSWLTDFFGGPDSATGIKVTESLALTSTAVYACVRIVAESVAALPLPVYERLDAGGKRRAFDHYLYPVLHDLPNPEMTSFQVRETLMGHLLLWGNAYAFLVRDAGDRVREIWPLRPDYMTIYRDPVSQQLQYVYALANGPQMRFDPHEVMHLRGLAHDGVRGYSPIAQNREAVALSLATQQYGAALFGNGGRPQGVLSVARSLSPDAKRNLREDWNSLYGGLSNANKVAVLEEGVTWQQVGLPPEDAQFLATRTFQINEIARMYRVPPHLLQELTRSTHNNIEHQGIDFVTHTIRPWLVRWEQSFRKDLFQPSEQGRFFAEFLVDGLLRGDLVSRYQAYSVGKAAGFLNTNEIRDAENLNPIGPEGDVYLQPLNMTALGGDTLPATTVKGSGNSNPADGGADEGESERSARVEAIFRPLVEDALRRCLRRERADTMRQAERLLPRGDEAKFATWRAQFEADHRSFVEQQFRPVVSAVSAALGREVSSVHLAPVTADGDWGAAFDAAEASAGDWAAAITQSLIHGESNA